MAKVIKLKEIEVPKKLYQKKLLCDCCSDCVYFEYSDDFEWCLLLNFSADDMRERGACAWAQLEGDNSARVIIQPVWEEDDEDIEDQDS